MNHTEKKDLTFEQALARLEELVRTLEEGGADLDASLSSFEEGIALVRFCTDKLDKAEQKVKLLLVDGDDENVKPVPFEE